MKSACEQDYYEAQFQRRVDTVADYTVLLFYIIIAALLYLTFHALGVV
jgi:hypothetical protein